MSQNYPPVSKPLKGPRAFSEISETASQPQAAILLMLARQLRGDDAALKARARATRAGRQVSESNLAARESFPVPQLRPSPRPVDARDVRARARRTLGFAAALDEKDFAAALTAGADRLYERETVDTAADLMEMCLSHPRELVRIAAAFAYLPITSAPARCTRILVRGLASLDDLERELAATALSRVQPDHRALRRFTRTRRRPARRGRGQTITLVHGTFASDAEWYQPPGGSFFTYIKGLRPDLYNAADFFSWSGGYSDGARAQGAADLKAWVDGHNEAGLDIMGHSHGANVILRATQQGMVAGKVVLLSCPVHVHKYFPNFANLKRPVYSVRVKMDLVILADLGGQRFNHPDIREIILPIWFDHGASHDPQVWQQHNIAQKIAL